MHRTWFATRCTGVIVVHITAVGVTVVPILPTFVGIGRTDVLLLTTTHSAVIHGWLSWETTAVALTATVALAVVGERALLLSGGIAAAQGLLAEGRAELDVCKLVWLFMISCMASNAAPKFASKSPYMATNASLSMAVIPYPCCKAGTAV